MPLLVTIGSFLPRLFGRKVNDATANVLGIIVTAILFGAIISLGKCAYDASVIDEYKTEQRADKAERDLRAERKADEEAEATRNELAETQQRLDDATAKAKADKPEEARKEVGPVTKSYYDTLRKEKRQ